MSSEDGPESWLLDIAGWLEGLVSGLAACFLTSSSSEAGVGCGQGREWQQRQVGGQLDLRVGLSLGWRGWCQSSPRYCDYLPYRVIVTHNGDRQVGRRYA
jgi:hypothetical protein